MHVYNNVMYARLCNSMTVYKPPDPHWTKSYHFHVFTSLWKGRLMAIVHQLENPFAFLGISTR